MLTSIVQEVMCLANDFGFFSIRMIPLILLMRQYNHGKKSFSMNYDKINYTLFFYKNKFYKNIEAQNRQRTMKI